MRRDRIVDSKIAPSLQAAYDEQYTDAMTEWRALGAKHKADNIETVCAGKRFDRVLDCGAGEGAVARALAKRGVFGSIHAAEISDSGIKQIERAGGLDGVVKFDGYTLPFDDDHFDMAYCSHVVEHVEHPRLLLRELARVSRHQVFEVPLDYFVGIERHVDSQLRIGHINVYTPTTFAYLLRTEGFAILREHRSQLAADVLRFAWYRNEGLPFSPKREAKLLLRPLIQRMRRAWMGAAKHDELAFDAYTCLARSDGELSIFDDA